MVEWGCSMENLEMSKGFWKDRVVFLTGHTGFKGGWTALWLTHLGAKVYGFSLEPPTNPSFYKEVGIEDIIFKSVIGDICNLENLSQEMKASNASVVIHMAAQPLVRDSYTYPVETFKTNIMGTINILESARKAETVRAVLNITTDKCYENKEWVWAYRENDRLGGHDPYSNSKACAELVTNSYKNSFFQDSLVSVATVRAGNVIGGGDWAKDRLIPDFFRSLDEDKILSIRSPNAIRPWQHVFEPISGYLKVAEKLVEEGHKFSEAWNFGPEDSDAKPVSWIVQELCNSIPNAEWEIEKSPQLHEAGNLKLDSSKSKNLLNWKPKWSLQNALEATTKWHLAWKKGDNMKSFSINQIKNFLELN